MIELDVWTDIACPFCYVGERRLEQALEAFPERDQVQVRWRSYQLRPDAAVGAGVPLFDAVSAARGLTAEQARERYEPVGDMARADGLPVDFDRAIAANTLDAHRLVHLAGADTERGAQVVDALFTAHFADGAVIDDRQALVDIAAAAGLDAAAVGAALDSDAALDLVREDQRLAAEFGVSGVPFFVANRKYAVSGAQPVEVLTQLLEAALGDG